MINDDFLSYEDKISRQDHRLGRKSAPNFVKLAFLFFLNLSDLSRVRLLYLLVFLSNIIKDHNLITEKAFLGFDFKVRGSVLELFMNSCQLIWNE